MTDETEDRTGASQRGHHAGEDASVPGLRPMSAKRKQGAVLQVLKSEPIEPLPTPRSKLRGTSGWPASRA